MGVIQERMGGDSHGRKWVHGISGGFAIKENRDIRPQLKGIAAPTIIVKVEIIGCLCCDWNYLA